MGEGRGGGGGGGGCVCETSVLGAEGRKVSVSGSSNGVYNGRKRKRSTFSVGLFLFFSFLLGFLFPGPSLNMIRPKRW